MAEFVCERESQLPEAAAFILEQAGTAKVMLFDGEMGSGKTTLIKAICAKLGSTSHFSSPTYALVNEYNSPSGKLYHFDLYRLKSMEELYDLGIEQYLDSGSFCFVEWPEFIKPVLEEEHLRVNIQVRTDGSRQITTGT